MIFALCFRGIDPDDIITNEDIRNARREVGYIDGCINTAVVGSQNEGKSTLINCLCGVEAGAEGSAEVGETEVTSVTTRYVDNIHEGFVWYDVPGSGVTSTRAWGYYEKLKLFAYDKIVLVHTATAKQACHPSLLVSRCTNTTNKVTPPLQSDIQIMQLCKYRGQECIVVRTKADQHVRNCRRRKKYATVEEARADYICQVREDTRISNSEAAVVRDLSPEYTDYIVCEMGINQLVRSLPPSEDECEQVINERRFLEKLGLRLDELDV